MQPIIFFADTAHPFLSEALGKLGYCCKHCSGTDRDEILVQAAEASGVVIRSKIKLDRDAIDRIPGLKFIARVGAGMENIDHAYAASKGIVCLNAPEGNRDAVGEHALGMLLSLFNHLCRVNAEVRKGIWIREANRGTEIQGKTIAIIGYGNTGSAFAEKLSGFGANVIAYDKYKTGFSELYVKETDMDSVFREADVVSLHVPLTEETRFMVNRPFIEKFEKPVYLLNTARGQCVDTSALMDAVDSGKVKGAALDVLEYEKFSFENLEAENLPEPFRRLIRSDRVILSPHIAGWTHESHLKMAQVLVEKISSFWKAE